MSLHTHEAISGVSKFKRLCFSTSEIFYETDSQRPFHTIKTQFGFTNSVGATLESHLRGQI